MFLRYLAITLAVALAYGCASVKDTYAADGRKAHTLNCSGLARGWDKCFSAAGEICKESGYDVVDRSSEDAAMGSVAGSPRGIAGSFAQTQERSMVIACKVRR